MEGISRKDIDNACDILRQQSRYIELADKIQKYDIIPNYEINEGMIERIDVIYNGSDKSENARKVKKEIIKAFVLTDERSCWNMPKISRKLTCPACHERYGFVSICLCMDDEDDCAWHKITNVANTKK